MGLKAEPVAWIGVFGTIIVGALTTFAGSGLVSGGSLDLVNTLIAVIPFVAGLIARRFVTPVNK